MNALFFGGYYDFVLGGRRLWGTVLKRGFEIDFFLFLSGFMVFCSVELTVFWRSKCFWSNCKTSWPYLLQCNSVSFLNISQNSERWLSVGIFVFFFNGSVLCSYSCGKRLICCTAFLLFGHFVLFFFFFGWSFQLCMQFLWNFWARFFLWKYFLHCLLSYFPPNSRIHWRKMFCFLFLPKLLVYVSNIEGRVTIFFGHVHLIS